MIYGNDPVHGMAHHIAKLELKRLGARVVPLQHIAQTSRQSMQVAAEIDAETFGKIAERMAFT